MRLCLRWVKLGFASTRPLKSWRVNLQERYQQLDDWINDPLNIPKASISNQLHISLARTVEPPGNGHTCCIASIQHVAQVVDISKLFNPQSYLTAIKQICCQDTGAELDKLQVFTDVTKKEPKQLTEGCKDGAYVSGMYLEGDR